MESTFSQPHPKDDDKKIFLILIILIVAIVWFMGFLNPKKEGMINTPNYLPNLNNHSTVNILEFYEDNVEARVKKVISTTIGGNENNITLDTKFEDLGADSLDNVELVMAFEEEFKIDIPDEAAVNMHTVRQVVNYIRQHGHS